MCIHVCVIVKATHYTGEFTTSPVAESPQGYWNVVGIKPNLPENVPSNICSGTYTYVRMYIDMYIEYCHRVVLIVLNNYFLQRN